MEAVVRSEISVSKPQPQSASTNHTSKGIPMESKATNLTPAKQLHSSHQSKARLHDSASITIASNGRDRERSPNLGSTNIKV